MTFSEHDKRRFVALQRPWPLTSAPLADLATTLDCTPAELLAFIHRLRDAGLVRRVGAVFDNRKLGYRSGLFAVDTRGEECDRIAAEIAKHPGVTHVYARGWPNDFTTPSINAADYEAIPKLWYTLSAPRDRFDEERATFENYHPLFLPALRRYKIDVILDPNARPSNPASLPLMRIEEECLTPIPTPDEQALIRRYQGDVASIEHPFEEADLPLLQQWQREGKLRRFALLPYHRAAGFSANGMCCWQVPETACDTFGQRLAASPEVTHCYARPLTPAFPYNLYAMIHKTSWQAGVDTFQALTQFAGLQAAPSRLLFSTKEYKKTSPLLFMH